MIELDCIVKNDEWGKLGSSSFVGQLLKCQRRTVNETTPYAALWMGVHQSGPSKVIGLSPDFDSKPIDSLLKAWPEFIGNIDIAAKYGFNLPILVKILSIGHSLPLQINLSSNSGSKSCKIILALTPSSLLCGFRPHNEIINNLKNFKDLRLLINSSTLTKYIQSVSGTQVESSQSNVYLMQCFNEAISNCQAQKSIDKALLESSEAIESTKINIILKSLSDKGLDTKSLVSFFFLNYVNLNCDQAVIIEANQVHMLLDGNYLEVSNPNDKVISSETTLENISASICVTQDSPKIVNPTSVDDCSYVYSPESSDWTVELINANQYNELSCPIYQASPTSSGSFILFLGPTEAIVNNVYRLKPGQIFFVPPGLPLRFTQLRGAFRLFRISLKS